MKQLLSIILTIVLFTPLALAIAQVIPEQPPVIHKTHHVHIGNMNEPESATITVNKHQDAIVINSIGKDFNYIQVNKSQFELIGQTGEYWVFKAGK
jgi:Na+-transporting NADH:ubiquinone oxidoreductase subunit NqrF